MLDGSLERPSSDMLFRSPESKGAMTSSWYLLAAASDTLRVWDTPSAPLNASTTGEQQQLEPRPVFCVKGATSAPRLTCWNGAFDTLATLYGSSQILTHETSGAPVEEIKLEGESEGSLNALSFGYRSSKFLYFGGSGKVVNVWDRQEGKLASVLKGHKSAIQTLSLSTDDQRCASGSSKGDLLIHSLKHGTKSTLVSPLKQGINQVQFYPFKKSILMAGGDEGTLVFWDIHSKLEPTQAKKEIHLGPITGIAFAPCNKHLYCTVGLDKVLRFHDINQSGQSILHSFTAPEALTSVTINEDHSVAVGTSKGSVILYDVRWKGPVFMIPSQSNAAVKSLAFQPPKWAIDASSKEKISVASFVRTHEFSEDAMPDTISKLEISKETTEHKAPSTGHKDRAMMDMFSPVNKNKISKLKNTADLRKVTLFKNLLSNQKEEGKVSLNLSEEDEVKPVPQAFEAPLPIAPVVHETVEEPPTNAHAWTEKEEENVPIVTVEEPTSISQEESRKTGGLVSSLPPPPIVTPTSPFMKMSAMVPSLAQSSNASGGSFQYNVLENIVQDCLADFRDQTRSDIQNMHIELLRQFQIQKLELESLFERHMPNEVLLDELARLREENARLRQLK